MLGVVPRRPLEARTSGLAGRHAIVTGGSSGIGLATACLLAERGASVSLIARRPDLLAAAADEVGTHGGTVRTATADVADDVALRAAISTSVAEGGPCDVLVTSAGVARPGHFGELSDEDFRRAMEVNYFGTLNAIRAVAPGMVERRRGHIVGISSAAALVGVFGYTAYGASKYAVRGLLEALRAEMVPHGVHVACAFPPDTDTPQLVEEDRFKPDETRAVAGSIKPLSAERVARSIVEGMERRDPWIIPDVPTRALARGSTLLRGTVNRYTDRAVRRSRAAP